MGVSRTPLIPVFCITSFLVMAGTIRAEESDRWTPATHVPAEKFLPPIASPSDDGTILVTAGGSSTLVTPANAVQTGSATPTAPTPAPPAGPVGSDPIGPTIVLPAPDQKSGVPGPFPGPLPDGFEPVPDGLIVPEGIGSVDPIFGETLNPFVVVDDGEPSECKECDPCHRAFRFELFKTDCDAGIGQERVMLAPFAIENAQPRKNYFRLRVNIAENMVFPDRAAFYWAQAGIGPRPEQSLDYQEVRFGLEAGSERFSLMTEFPLRILDPVVNDNTAGFGMMVLTPKTVLINGDNWLVTMMMRNNIDLGPEVRGVSNGNFSMEPGLLLRYRWSDRTYLHSEFRYWMAFGAEPFGGQVFRYGFGISNVLYETNTFAILPTAEVVAWSVVDGLKTLPNGATAPVDGENFGSLQLGTIFVFGPQNDLGLFEVGLNSSLMMANNGLYEHQIRFDFRWSW